MVISVIFLCCERIWELSERKRVKTSEHGNAWTQLESDSETCSSRPEEKPLDLLLGYSGMKGACPGGLQYSSGRPKC